MGSEAGAQARRGGPAPLLIVGLGNPGSRYEHTRHNAGADAVRRLARRWNLALRRPWFQRAWTARRGDTLLAVPDAFMNVSGPVVARLAAKAGGHPPLVVSDDLDLPLGAIRFRTRGTAGGHNGLKSVIAALGSEAFPRLKIGIGRPADGGDVVRWVLSPYAPAEREEAERALDAAAAALHDAAELGLERAMTAHSR